MLLFLFRISFETYGSFYLDLAGISGIIAVAVAAAALPIKFLLKNTLLFRRNLFLFFSIYNTYTCILSLFSRIGVQYEIFTCQRKSSMVGEHFSNVDYIESEGIDFGNQ